MAIGIARMVGVRFPENFDSPYKAASVIDFWRRWHMTLSYFLRDYVYIPLGGNRHGELRQHLNLFLTMLIGGLWHGANWTFVVWGAVHGVMLSINHAWRRMGLKLPEWVGWMLTFTAVVSAFVIFRAGSFSRASGILTAMAGANGFRIAGSDLADPGKLRILLPALALVLLAPNRQTIVNREWRSDWAYAATFATLICISLLSIANPPPFIYFQF
jgi:alginate O-acetyltransferase complex protein AlgI